MDLVSRLKERRGLMTVKQVAMELGCDMQTVYRRVWAKPTKLPHIRVNQRIMFDPAVLAQWLEARSV